MSGYGCASLIIIMVIWSPTGKCKFVEEKKNEELLCRCGQTSSNEVNQIFSTGKFFSFGGYLPWHLVCVKWTITFHEYLMSSKCVEYKERPKRPMENAVKNSTKFMWHNNVSTALNKYSFRLGMFAFIIESNPKSKVKNDILLVSLMANEDVDFWNTHANTHDWRVATTSGH